MGVRPTLRLKSVCLDHRFLKPGFIHSPYDTKEFRRKSPDLWSVFLAGVAVQGNCSTKCRQRPPSGRPGLGGGSDLRAVTAVAPPLGVRALPRPTCRTGRLRRGAGELPKFVRLLFCRRDVSASLDTLRLRSSNVDGVHDEDHARSWILDGIKRGARVIHVVGHRRVHFLKGRSSSLAVLEHTAFVSSHLKVLKLSYALLDDNMLRQLSSQCPALEEQHLMDCVMTGHEISSASLKILTMFKCKINVNLSVASPNLILLRCVSPITQALSFGDMGLLVTGTIILDDRSFYEDDFEDFSKDELEETTDEDDNDSYWKDKNRYGFGVPLDGYCFKCNHDYGSDIESDDNTYEYSEIANDSAEYGFDGDDHSSSKDAKHHVYGENSGSNDNKVLGGHNVLHSLSNATSLELLADAGEV
ncbi:hypothetical protein EJB05_56165, partial [Eragrostis curvula]